MISYVRGDHFRRVFRRLYTRTSVQEHCVQFIESLISQPPPGLKDLQADDLMPLLQAPDHEVRMPSNPPGIPSPNHFAGATGHDPDTRKILTSFSSNAKFTTKPLSLLQLGHPSAFVFNISIEIP